MVESLSGLELATTAIRVLMNQDSGSPRRVGISLACSLSFLLSVAIQTAYSDTDPKFYAVQASANVQVSPPQITLVWSPDSNATGYSVSRKSPGSSAWGGPSSLPGSATSFVDSSVSTGVAYEYQISKSTSVGYQGFGYVYAGINAPLIEGRGKLILIVDSLFTTDLANELTRLEQDLVGDGWMVIRHDVSRTDSPSNIKSLIQADYNADPANVRTVFLFGHVPVPYSGNLNPDGHPDHQGAWPADAYYGDMDGSWTDSSVNNTGAQRQANWNVPGDGKFDQSELPSDIELEVGRVDLATMTCFSNKTPARYEEDLLRQYLNKDHAFRQGLLAIQRRGLVCDNFGEKSGEAFAASGWRNFAAFFGADNVTSVAGWDYFSTLSSDSYLWSYGCGGGSYYTCDGIGSSDDFANTDVKTVFLMLLGSYFGDWDNESNFLRAPLGSTSSALVVAWAGRPHWFLHHMGLGETIGYSARLSQNNRNGGTYSPQNYATHDIHIALMGDPTLRLHPVIPPSGLNGTASIKGMTLSWTSSPDTDLQGYHVYRATAPSAAFVRLTGDSPLQQTTFTDSTATTNSFTYMVRAIKLEHSGSGTYLNPSQGIFYGPENGTSWGWAAGGTAPTLPPAPSLLTASANSASQIALSWTDLGNNTIGFEIQRKTGTDGTYIQIATTAAGLTTYTDTGLAPATFYSYRVSEYNTVGDSPFSNEASAITSDLPKVPAAAGFLQTDRTTQGNWSTAYGSDGFNIVADSSKYPTYASVNSSGSFDWTWAWSTSDPRAPQRYTTADRIAACWNSASSFTVDIALEDGLPHRVALYCLDWDSGARLQTVDVTDADTGEILNSQALSDFSGGAYLVWNMAGHIIVRFTRNAGHNAVLSGIFFDPPGPTPTTVAAPTITPNGGTFSGPTTVALATTTPGATIRYTLDGSEPNAASTLYSAPFTITISSTISAKAFKAGMADSPVASAPFLLNAISRGQSQVLFIKADSNTQGNWHGVYGNEGYLVIGDNASTSLPGYAEVAPSGSEEYTWSDSTSNPRALQESDAADRIAACWESPTTFSVDVNFTDGATHRLALYCLDWDTTARVQTVDLLDAGTGALLNGQTISHFDAGVYLVWDIKGHVQVRFTTVAGNNAVLMGLFFSPAAMQLTSPDSGLLTVTSAVGGAFQFQVSGQVGERFAIQASSDLVQWQEIDDVTLTDKTLQFTDPDAAKFPVRFYRAIPTAGGSPDSPAQ